MLPADQIEQTNGPGHAEIQVLEHEIRRQAQICFHCACAKRGQQQSIRAGRPTNPPNASRSSPPGQEHILEQEDGKETLGAGGDGTFSRPCPLRRQR